MSSSANLFSGVFQRGFVSLPKRAARKALREVRKAFGPSSILSCKRNVAFPLRNVLLGRKPVTVNACGHAIKLVADGAIAAGIWAGIEYEPAELDFVRRVLRRDSVFIDVGANAGIFSLVASQTSPDGKILALEPAQKTFELLRRNIELNDAGNVTPVRTALGNYAGEATLNINVRGKDGLNTLGKPSHPDCESAGTEVVPITTLDEVLESNGVGRVDVMKVDAEGAELFVLEGARSLLGRPDAPVILYEAFAFLARGFDYHPVEIFWLLEKWGFSFFTLDSETGRLAEPHASRAYDSMVVAVKPSHPSYALIKDLSS